MTQWIQTLDDLQHILWEPRPTTISIEVIARVLSRTGRFGNHCKLWYSVGQHSRYVHDLVPRHLRLAALLHDGHEAYWGFGDVCRPAKCITDEVASALSDLAYEHDKAIAEHFGFDHTLFDDPAIKQADNIMLATEARDLMGPMPAPWITLPTPFGMRVVPWTAEASEAEFLRAYRKITADGSS